MLENFVENKQNSVGVEQILRKRDNTAPPTINSREVSPNQRGNIPPTNIFHHSPPPVSNQVEERVYPPATTTYPYQFSDNSVTNYPYLKEFIERGIPGQQRMRFRDRDNNGCPDIAVCHSRNQDDMLKYAVDIKAKGGGHLKKVHLSFLKRKKYFGMYMALDFRVGSWFTGKGQSTLFFYWKKTQKRPWRNGESWTSILGEIRIS